MLEVSYARRQCNSHTLVAVNQNPRLAAVLENVLAEVLETNNCVRYQPLSTHFFFFNILCGEVVKWEGHTKGFFSTWCNSCLEEEYMSSCLCCALT